MTSLITAESVTAGHPDKICDQVSDAVLDAILAKDPLAHVDCKCIILPSVLIIGGHVRTTAKVHYEEIGRFVIREIGYTDPTFGFDANNCRVDVEIREQSQDIAQGVDASPPKSKDLGAGDSGFMVGYACKQTPEFMPLPITLAHRLARKLDDVRKQNVLTYLRPDGKCQVTIETDENGQPKRLRSVIVSAQHSSDVSLDQLTRDLRMHVVEPVCASLLDERTIIHVNPTGRFVIGGPAADVGLTGRKIIVDTYGSAARHGGGALSGKDPTKVDRSGAYAARWIAKHIVKAGLADCCEVSVSYVIGRAEPDALRVETFGTGTMPDHILEAAVRKVFDLRPAAVIHDLDLLHPQYRALAVYGQMGREELGVKWELCDRVDALVRAGG